MRFRYVIEVEKTLDRAVVVPSRVCFRLWVRFQKVYYLC